MTASPRQSWTLRFEDPALEAEFQAELARERRRELQLGAVVLVALYAAFGIVDVRAYPESASALLTLRFGVVLPLLGAAFPVLFLERYRALFERRLQEVLLYLGVVATGGVLSMGAYLHEEMTPAQALVGAAGQMTALSFMYGFTQLRFTFAAALGVLSTLAGLAYAALLVRTPPAIYGALVLFGVASNAGGLRVVRTFEGLARTDFLARRAIQREGRRSEELLTNALPPHVAARLYDRDTDEERPALAERHESMTVLVADLVDFTPLSEQLGEAELARWLDRLYARFDGLGARHGVEKIKTLGDAWIAAAGGPVPAADHADRVARLARDLLAAMPELQGGAPTPVQVRIGIHTGPAVGGVIGRTRFAFDLWGEAVDGAKAMEAESTPGRARLSAATCAALLDPEALDLEPTALDASDRWLGPGEPPPTEHVAPPSSLSGEARSSGDGRVAASTGSRAASGEAVPIDPPRQNARVRSARLESRGDGSA